MKFLGQRATTMGSKTERGGRRREECAATLTRLCPRLLSPELLGQPPPLTASSTSSRGPLQGVDLITSTSASSSTPGTTELQKNMQAPWLAARLPSRTSCLPVSPASPAATPHTQPLPQPNQATPRPLHAEPRGTGLASQFLSPSRSLSGQLLLILQNSLHVLPPPRSPP